MVVYLADMIEPHRDYPGVESCARPWAGLARRAVRSCYQQSMMASRRRAQAHPPRHRRGLEPLVAGGRDERRDAAPRRSSSEPPRPRGATARHGAPRSRPSRPSAPRRQHKMSTAARPHDEDAAATSATTSRSRSGAILVGMLDLRCSSRRRQRHRAVGGRNASRARPARARGPRVARARRTCSSSASRAGRAVGFIAVRVDRANKQIYGIAIPDGAFIEVPGPGLRARRGELRDAARRSRCRRSRTT